jgi:hypothetical protein
MASALNSEIMVRSNVAFRKVVGEAIFLGTIESCWKKYASHENILRSASQASSVGEGPDRRCGCSLATYASAI